MKKCKKCGTELKREEIRGIITLTDFEIEMAGTGIGAGAQLHQKAVVTLDNDKKIIINDDTDINNLETGSIYVRCGCCYGDSCYYNEVRNI